MAPRRERDTTNAGKDQGRSSVAGGASMASPRDPCRLPQPAEPLPHKKRHRRHQPPDHPPLHAPRSRLARRSRHPRPLPPAEHPLPAGAAAPARPSYATTAAAATPGPTASRSPRHTSIVPHAPPRSAELPPIHRAPFSPRAQEPAQLPRGRQHQNHHADPVRQAPPCPPSPPPPHRQLPRGRPPNAAIGITHSPLKAQWAG